MGDGKAHDVGIRLLILAVSSLSSLVIYYVMRDIKGFGGKLDKASDDIKGLQGSMHSMDDSLYKYKQQVGEILLKNTEAMHSESHLIRVGMVNLEGKLAETNAHLERSHETREDVYGIMSKFTALQAKHEELANHQKDQFGRVIVLEKFTSRYQTLLNGFEKMIKARKDRNGKS